MSFEFRHDGHTAGVIAKFNQMSVTVLSDDGYRYNVARGLRTAEDDPQR